MFPQYDLELLKKLCGRSLCNKLSIETAAQLFVLADRHSEAQLRTISAQFIRDHAAEVIVTEGWKMVDNTRIVEAFRELSQNDPDSDFDSESDSEPE